MSVSPAAALTIFIPALRRDISVGTFLEIRSS
jgi:hypothetical protein